MPELLDAADTAADDLPELGILAITSADRLLEDWRDAQERRARGGPPAP